jgi:hypothetical protein
MRSAVPDLGRVTQGWGPVTGFRELPGDHPLQLPPRDRPAGPVPGGALTGSGRDEAALDPALVTRAHVEAFQAWMISTRSAATALNKHKGLQQFFTWLLVDEQAMDRNPIARVRQPKSPTKVTTTRCHFRLQRRPSIPRFLSAWTASLL